MKDELKRIRAKRKQYRFSDKIVSTIERLAHERQCTEPEVIEYLVQIEKRSEQGDIEVERLRAGFNRLVGAIINKKIEGLEVELEEARFVLEQKDE